jgi:hypothetical protein
VEVLIMDTTTLLWNGALTLAAAFFGVMSFLVKDKIAKIDAIDKTLTDTRVEVARENVTKAEVQNLERHIDARFNKLEEKIDRLIEAR